MRHHTRIPLARAWLAAASLALACSSATEPRPIDFAFAEVNGTKPPPFGATSPPTVRVPGQGRVEVAGIIPTGNPCHDVEASVEREGRRLELTVTARGLNQPCIARTASFAYSAAITDLAAGEYQLSVVHAYRNSGWPAGEVLSTSVTVP